MLTSQHPKLDLQNWEYFSIYLHFCQKKAFPCFFPPGKFLEPTPPEGQLPHSPKYLLQGPVIQVIKIRWKRYVRLMHTQKKQTVTHVPCLAKYFGKCFQTSNPTSIPVINQTETNLTRNMFFIVN